MEPVNEWFGRKVRPFTSGVTVIGMFFVDPSTSVTSEMKVAAMGTPAHYQPCLPIRNVLWAIRLANVRAN